MTFTVSFKGEVDFLSAIDKLGEKIAVRSLEKAVAAGAKIVSDAAKANAPVYKGTYRIGKTKTGRSILIVPGLLKRSVQFRKVKQTDSLVEYDVGVSTKAFYAHMVEFGTKKMGAQSFLRPAYDEKSEEAVFTIGRKIGDTIDKAVASIANKVK